MVTKIIDTLNCRVSSPSRYCVNDFFVLFLIMFKSALVSTPGLLTNFIDMFGQYELLEERCLIAFDYLISICCRSNC